MTQLTWIVATTIRRTIIVQNPYRGLDTVPKTGPFILSDSNSGSESSSSSDNSAEPYRAKSRRHSDLSDSSHSSGSSKSSDESADRDRGNLLAMAPMIRRTTTTMIQERILEKVKKVEVSVARQSDSSHVESDV
jgi:hypothetical protein